MGLGVIIGRFQVARPHLGHVELVTRVHAIHGRVLLLVGQSAGLPSLRNPIPASLRVKMLRHFFPDESVEVGILPDCPTDGAWSQSIDHMLLGREDLAVLYGGRDNCLSHYSGILKTVTLPVWSGMVSATEHRDAVEPSITEEFLRGLIYAQRLRVPLSYQTVDMVVYNPGRREVVLGQKNIDIPAWRLPGGFVDPTDASLEAAALRELSEEIGQLGLASPVYIGSQPIDDYRYRGQADRVKTALFAVEYQWGHLKAGDDLDRVEWVPYLDLLDRLHPMHRPLGERFLAYDKERQGLHV